MQNCKAKIPNPACINFPILKISIAIPDSALKDESTHLDKSRKASLIARACAIFKVDTIYLYEESGGSEADRFLLSLILRYLETPQYLRKALFPKLDELKYAGILHPLQIPHHSLLANPKYLKVGDIREGVVLHHKGKKFLDIGTFDPIIYHGKEHEKKRLTVQIKTVVPTVTVKEISENEVKQYWGYKVKERSNLLKLLTEWKGDSLLTSRKGKMRHKNTWIIMSSLKSHCFWFLEGQIGECMKCLASG